MYAVLPRKDLLSSRKFCSRYVGIYNLRVLKLFVVCNVILDFKPLVRSRFTTTLVSLGSLGFQISLKLLKMTFWRRDMRLYPCHVL